MKQLIESKLLKKYIADYNLQDYMDVDLFSIARLYSFEADEHLIQSGIISDYLYFLVDGKLMVYSYTSDTQNICISYFYQSTLIGEAASLWEMIPSSSVKTMTPCICVCIPLKTYRKTLQNDLRFLKNSSQILSYRLNSGIHLANSLSEAVDVRLAKFILEQAKNDIFSFQLTTCADILNVSYRHLIRTLTSFRELNILRKIKSSYEILDYLALEKLAKN